MEKTIDRRIEFYRSTHGTDASIAISADINKAAAAQLWDEVVLLQRARLRLQRRMLAEEIALRLAKERKASFSFAELPEHDGDDA